MRGNSWIINELPELLVKDWYNLYIYSEYDMQVATYYWLRAYFDQERDKNWIIRTQPTLIVKKEFRPDIALFRNTKIYDVMELKFQLNSFDESALLKDLDKFKRLRNAYYIRHAYQIVLYDDDKNIELPSYRKDPWMKKYVTFVGANVRRQRNRRMRSGYAGVRERWDRWNSLKFFPDSYIRKRR